MNDAIFIDNSIEVKEALKKYEEMFLTEAATMIESQVKQNWKHVVDIANHEAVVGNPLENAVWEEFGTGDYAIKDSRRVRLGMFRSRDILGKRSPPIKVRSLLYMVKTVWHITKPTVNVLAEPYIKPLKRKNLLSYAERSSLQGRSLSDFTRTEFYILKA